MTIQYKKVDDEKVRVTETLPMPEPVVTEYNRVVLQTELDHIPDRRAKIQADTDAVDAREAELNTMLGVFK